MVLNDTAADIRMNRRYGPAPDGERWQVAIPDGHDKTATITAGLHTAGLVASALFSWRHVWQAFPRLRHRHPGSGAPAGRHRHSRQPAAPQGGWRWGRHRMHALLPCLPPDSLDFEPLGKGSPRSRRSFAVRRSASSRIWDVRSKKLQMDSNRPSTEVSGRSRWHAPRRLMLCRAECLRLGRLLAGRICRPLELPCHRNPLALDEAKRETKCMQTQGFAWNFCVGRAQGLQSHP